MKLLKYLLLFLPLFIGANKISAQGKTGGTVRGFVYDKGNGSAILFTNVFLDGTSYGATTDENGFFSFGNVPEGNYTLKIKSFNYQEYSEDIEITKGGLISRKIYLEASAIEMDEVEVSAERSRNTTQVKMSVTKISPKEIKALPSVGGQPDLAQYLQVLPGVIFTGDQGGQLYIRGGSPIQNLVLLDGMTIYNPFHSIGLFSVFDTEIISNADVYTGGFNARYGGRISSVMDIKTRAGNKTRNSGKIGVNPFGARLLLEGPLKKLDEETGLSTSYILSAKTSYLEQSANQFYSYASEDGLPYTFTDLYGKLSFNSRSGSQFNLFGFNFQDNVNYQGVSQLGWNSYGFGSHFLAVPSASPVIIEGNFAYSQYGISLQEEGLSERSSSVGNFNLGLNFKYFNGDNETRYGFNVYGIRTTFDYFNRFGAGFNTSDNATEMALYFLKKFKAGSFVFEPSIRTHYYASVSEFVVEPRLGVKYNLSEFVRLKAATGRYSQNLIAGNSDRDVVNLFYAFLSSPTNLPETFVNENGERVSIDSKLQKADHFIGGVELDVTKRFSINAEAYFKNFRQLTNVNRNKIFEDNLANEGRPEELRKDYVLETGDAKGLDFTFKYNAPRYYVWLVYSLGKVTRWDGEKYYPPVFDRRHNLNFVSSVFLGKKRNWELSGRWNFGTPFPFTQTRGFFEQLTFNGGYNSDFTDENGSFAIENGGLNQGRLSTYHRFDLSLKHTWEISEHRSLETVVSVTNVYNRNNIFYIDAIRGNKVYQLPILPSLGVTYTF
ncbi:TonB-dependent receptor [Luteibaculum oceani]|uniref:TonB-dependent receptor n=1 Tax=Luteibaculum oceani TaxID=1294296 RepID=A0A5C6V9B5_9FLAO|nr:TonB-dependent receptor [Luteibaculum oceani]TXC81727.1 TonB-dependent receptor [Luteibaculum oceani]